MQQVRCVKPFGTAEVGDLAEVPDGAAVSPEFWEPVTEPVAAAEPEAAPAPASSPGWPVRPHLNQRGFAQREM